MRAIVVNPYARKVSRVLDEFQDPRVLQHYVQSTTLTNTPLGGGNVLVVDEFGPYRKNQRWFGLVGMPVAVAGKAVMLRLEDGDEPRFLSCQYPEDAIQKVIRFFVDDVEPRAMLDAINPDVEVRYETMDREVVGRDGKVSTLEHRS